MLFWQLKMGEVQSHPAIERYLQNVSQRPSYQKFAEFLVMRDKNIKKPTIGFFFSLHKVQIDQVQILV
jgi:hypothetical protein